MCGNIIYNKVDNTKPITQLNDYSKDCDSILRSQYFTSTALRITKIV